MKEISKDISVSIVQSGVLLAAKMFDDAKRIAVEALNDPKY